MSWLSCASINDNKIRIENFLLFIIFDIFILIFKLFIATTNKGEGEGGDNSRHSSVTATNQCCSSEGATKQLMSLN